jgi:transcriptional regulator with XRE-family HTH domain
MPKTRAEVLAERAEQARRLGQVLARARESAGLTQVQAANSLGVPQSRIAKLELGQRQLLFLEALRVARLYDVDPVTLDPGPICRSGPRRSGPQRHSVRAVRIR